MWYCVWLATNSGWYVIFENSKEHTSRLKEGERLLQCLEEDRESIEVVDNTQLQFKIVSFQIANKWYPVTLQANYCDCPDWNDEYKHLHGKWLIVMRYFSQLSSVLSIIENDYHMFFPMTKDAINVSKDEQAKMCIQETLFSLENWISSKSSMEVEVVLHQLQLFKDTFGFFGVS